MEIDFHNTYICFVSGHYPFKQPNQIYKYDVFNNQSQR
jgi:hypothetical protein